MSKRAEVGIIMFGDSSFTSEEKKYLKDIEGDIVTTLLAHDIVGRPGWISGTGPSGRIIKLVMKEGTILELASAEIPNLSRDDVLSRLHRGIEDIAK